MKTDIHQLLDFISFTHDIREVKRAMWVKNDTVYENDSEHAYQLAMVSMFVIESEELELDVSKCMGLALVHDVLEVYAGDTPIYGSAELQNTKAEREREAIKTLKTKWPQLKVMHALIDEYEALDSSESKFVYALDKLIPTANNCLDGGRNWKREGTRLEDIKKAKSRKIAVDETVNDYYQQLIKILESRPELFEA